MGDPVRQKLGKISLKTVHAQDRIRRGVEFIVELIKREEREGGLKRVG